MNNFRHPSVGFWLGTILSVVPVITVIRSFPSAADDVDGFARTLSFPFIAAAIAVIAIFLWSLYRGKYWARLSLVIFVPFGLIWTIAWLTGNKPLPIGYDSAGPLALTAYMIIGVACLAGFELLAIRNLRKQP